MELDISVTQNNNYLTEKDKRSIIMGMFLKDIFKME